MMYWLHIKENGEITDIHFNKRVSYDTMKNNIDQDKTKKDAINIIIKNIYLVDY